MGSMTMGHKAGSGQTIRAYRPCWSGAGAHCPEAAKQPVNELAASIAGILGRTGEGNVVGGGAEQGVGTTFMLLPTSV